MKRIAIFIALFLLAASATVGVNAWRWRERKLRDDQWNREQSAAENDAAGKLGLKTQPLPPHPLERRLALDEVLRLEPDRRFLLAARELADADVAARFANGGWILSRGGREFGRIGELPDFPELMNALAPLAKEWVAAQKVTGKAPRIRAVRGHKEAFAAIRDAQTRWSKGDHGATVLHDAASATAALMLQLPRAFDADDRLDAHAIALSAADAAAGADVRGQRAVLALALGYFGAARALAPAEEEPALHAFLAPDRRKLAEAARRKDANAGDRHLFFRWLMQDADEKALLRFIGAARDNEHVSIPAVGQFLIDTDLQVVAAASDALPALALAELENVRPTAPTDVEPLRALMTARNSALQTLGNNEDLRARLATDLQQADTTYAGPLWRAADTSAWYAAATGSALLGLARSGYVLRNDASGLADELGTWPLPAAGPLNRWLKARIAADRGSLDEAYGTLASSKLPGARAAADLLDALARQSEPPDPRMIEAVRVALRHFDSRPLSRLVWAEVLRIHARDLDRFGRLAASIVDDAPGKYLGDEAALWKQRGDLFRVKELGLDERLPFAARLEAARMLVDERNGWASIVLSRLSRERPADLETRELRIRTIHDPAGPAGLSVALDLLRAYGDDDSFRVAGARCEAAHQLDGMGKHEEALAMVERALPTEAVCAYRIACVQLAKLGKKEDAENLLLAHFARHPYAETAVTIAEVRWWSHNDAGAADILAHPPAGLTRRDFRELGARFADVFRGRPAADAKHAIEALLQAGIRPESIVELVPPLAKAGAAAQAFEVSALLSQKVPPEKNAGVLLSAWSASRAAKGAPAAEAWLRTQPNLVDDELAAAAYGGGFDDALWELFPNRPLDPAFADRLTLLRAASMVRRGERSARRDALQKDLSDPLARWKARLARFLGLPGAYESWEVQLARYVLGEDGEEEIADAATEGSRPCEAPYYFGVHAARKFHLGNARAWYRVALECRNPEQPEFVWAHRAASEVERDPPRPQYETPPSNSPQAAR